MSLLAAILDTRCTAVDVEVSSRKRALEWVGERVAQVHGELNADDIYDALQARERLGSTGLGEGVAIPHCRTNCTDIVAVFARLEQAVDFDAPDDEDVDLVFALIVPEEETSRHLTVLSQLSQVFSEPRNLTALRRAATAEDLRDQLLERAPQEAA